MTRLIALALSAAMLLAPGGQEKVTICHNDTITITIGAPAVDAHVNNHGDTLGECAQGGLGPVEPPLDPPITTTTTTTTLPPTTTTLPPTTTTTEPPDHNTHEPHSHDEMVLRCTVIDDG